jgi:hypothetical protein
LEQEIAEVGAEIERAGPRSMSRRFGGSKLRPASIGLPPAA